MSSADPVRLAVVGRRLEGQAGVMTTNALALLTDSTVTLRVIDGGNLRAQERQHRAMLRTIAGGCPDHWWKPTAPRTSACTCDRG
jgi:hypothetical protein